MIPGVLFASDAPNMVRRGFWLVHVEVGDRIKRLRVSKATGKARSWWSE